MNNERKASKKNKGVLGIVSMLLIILLLTGTGGYTLAKYATQEKAVGKTQIANWAFKIQKDGTETKTINLASTVKKDTLVNGKIAPGTSGTFDITIDATGSEVEIEYLVQFLNEKNKPTNLIFTYSGNTVKTLGALGDIKGNITVGGSKIIVLNVKWVWPYETGLSYEEKNQNDIIDTQNGTSPLDYTFDILVKGTQSK